MLIFVIIPAYNEAGSIGNVIKDIRESVKDFMLRGDRAGVVVVDDGSTDETSRVAKEAGAIVLCHCVNRGQGASLATATKYCLLNNADIIIHFDADGQHDATDIPILVRTLLDGQYDIILGSRFLGRALNIPLFKLITLKIAILFTRLFSGISTTDTHNGIRALTKHAASVIQLTQDRMAHASEIIDEIKRNNLKFKEVGVTIRYTSYASQKGQSIFNAFSIVCDLIGSKIQKILNSKF